MKSAREVLKKGGNRDKTVAREGKNSERTFISYGDA
jgi:hypothetical protein